MRTVDHGPAVRASALRALALVFALRLLSPRPAAAWFFPEHRDITDRAIIQLPPEARRALQQLWDQARVGYGAPLCTTLAAGDQGLAPGCVDFSAWPALAGDHSCSPRDFASNVLPSPWVLAVSHVAAQTKDRLASARSRQQKLNDIAVAHLDMQAADPDYATRAESNSSHFPLPRSSDDVDTYVRGAVSPGAPVNALGLYAHYHRAALAAAQRLAASPAGGDAGARAADARRVLALEGFALHFLEDIFSSGHVVGTWGSTPWRKGTHDYYCEFGFDGQRWNGQEVILFGDNYMKPADWERTAAAVEQSLGQLARALEPGQTPPAAGITIGVDPESAYTFDACQQKVQPSAAGADAVALTTQMRAILLATPVPGRGEGDVHMPRFREQLGPFIGVFGTLGGGAAWGGLAPPGARGLINLAGGLRVGFGADSLTGTPGTAIAFVEGGLEMTAAQVSKCSGEGCSLIGTSSLFPAVPSRVGLRLGLRLPFWVLPGDMLVLGPVLAIVSPRRLTNVAVAAASGGLIPYERTVDTRVGTFQLIAGREIQATLFGYLGDTLVPLYIAAIGTAADGTTQFGVVLEKSVAIDFPVIDWTPFRETATQLAFAGHMQLGFGIELPLHTEVLFPANAPAVSPPVVWSVFLRLPIEIRHFFGTREDLQAPR